MARTSGFALGNDDDAGAQLDLAGERGDIREGHRWIEHRVQRRQRRRWCLRIGQHDMLPRPHRLEASLLGGNGNSPGAFGTDRITQRPHVDLEQPDLHCIPFVVWCRAGSAARRPQALSGS